jgi:hypothetical protein
VISYRPPKGQIWGHRRGDLSAEQLLERTDLLLREYAVIQKPPSGEFSIGWGPLEDDVVRPAVDDLGRALVAVAQATPPVGSPGRSSMQFRCALAPDDVRVAAKWLDALYKKLGERPLGVMLNMFLNFEWKPWRTGEGESKTGVWSMLMLQLAKPRGLTTMFGFADAAHYREMKKYLAEIDLVELNDKHVRPKGALGKVQAG